MILDWGILLLLLPREFYHDIGCFVVFSIQEAVGVCVTPDLESIQGAGLFARIIFIEYVVDGVFNAIFDLSG